MLYESEIETPLAYETRLDCEAQSCVLFYQSRICRLSPQRLRSTILRALFRPSMTRSRTTRVTHRMCTVVVKNQEIQIFRSAFDPELPCTHKIKISRAL